MPVLPRNLSFSRQVLPVLALLGLILAVYFIATGLPDRALSEPAEEPPRAPQELANAARVAGAGIVEPSSEVIDIGTAVAGLVTAVRVQPGEYVTKGQPLFQVDDRAIRARIRETDAAIGEARASIADAQAAVATATRQLELYRSVSDPAAVSRAEVIRAEGDASAARTRLQAARARLGSTQAAQSSATTELSRLVVRAPISGEILAVDIRPGEYVSTVSGSSSFIRMGETRPLHVRIDIDESEAARVALGEPATISPRGASERQVKAAFVRAEPQVVPKRSLTNSAAERVDVRVLQVIYALPESASAEDALFRVGQQVDAYIPARRGGAKPATKPAAGADESE